MFWLALGAGFYAVISGIAFGRLYQLVEKNSRLLNFREQDQAKIYDEIVSFGTKITDQIRSQSIDRDGRIVRGLSKELALPISRYTLQRNPVQSNLSLKMYW